MDNQEIITRIVKRIEEVKIERGLNDVQLAALCKQTNNKVSENTIRTMFKKPTSVRVTTLLNVCNSLGLNLRAVFHSIELSSTSDGAQDRFIYDVHNPYFHPYLGEFHVFFLPTHATKTSAEDFRAAIPKEDRQYVLRAEKQDLEYQLARTHKYPLHGSLQFGDQSQMGECTASLVIDTGDLDKDTHQPVKKNYEGRLVWSSHGVMTCSLTAGGLGDIWFIVFPHALLNNMPMICTMGVASTISSGQPRVPTIHRFCLINKSIYNDIPKETRFAIRGLLRVQGEHVTIKKEVVDEFLSRNNIDKNFRRNLENHLNIAPLYYRIPKGYLTEGVDPTVYANMLADLCNQSDLSRAYHIMAEDNTVLTNLLKPINDPM